jgi:AcrR family transcriptional regulator
MKRTPKTRDADLSRQRIWDAAVQQFAAAGFDGAKVDAIARDAGVNKAMLYYHFADKLALYHAILRDMFAAVADATERVRAGGGTAETQLRAYVAALVQAAEERPHFPAIWFREVADAGRHLDPGVFKELQRVLLHLGGILADGRRDHGWGPADPFLIQAGIVAPLMLILATRRMRADNGIGPAIGENPTVLIDHFTGMTLAVLTAATRRPV